MFNHARTLLLNQDGKTVVPDWALGEEAVPAAYPQLPLHTYLLDLRERLFGASPDRSFLNYRLAQYLNLIHATELAEFVVALDRRITYLPFNLPDLFSPAAFMPVILPLTTGLRSPQWVAGNLATPDAAGRMYWQINVTTQASGGGFNAIIADYQRPRRQIAVSYSVSNGLSTSPVPLFDSGYSLYLPNQAGSWDTSFHLRPGWDLGQVLAALHIVGEPTLLSLFGVKPEGAYKTFHALFNQHSELAYRLGAVVLAVAYRTEEIRQRVEGATNG